MTIMKNNKPHLLVVIADAIMAVVLFFISVAMIDQIPYWFGFVAIAVWILVSLVLQKLNYSEYKRVRSVIAVTLIVNVLNFAVIFFLAKAMSFEISFSWKYVLLYIILTVLEIILYAVYRRLFIVTVNYSEDEEISHYTADSCRHQSDIDGDVNELATSLFETLQNDFPNNPEQWAEKHAKDFKGKVSILTTPTSEELDSLLGMGVEHVINVSKFNDIRYINRYFIKLNGILPYGGVFAIGGVVSDVRKQIIYDTYPPVIRTIVYIFDFIWNRIFPKMVLFKKLYFAVTKGKHRVFPRSEIMGRLYSCGFEIVSEQVVNDHFFVVVQKTKEPFDDKNPSYGPLIRLRRIGKGGKTIGVYKFRTMHAYSEYLQAYIYKQNSLQEGGKIADDYRISTIGHFLRKYWIDELPMILNFFKGDLKLVGVRPLSKHYLNLYTPEMQELHIKVKPGLMPPFYVDMPITLEEIQESERKYIEEYLKHPLYTDWKYFWKILRNIVLRHKHSA